MGRADEQVKIRGYRIELGEVEAALAQYPAVDEAVVVARGDGEDRELVAYVVARTAEPLQEELRSYLEEKLPRYMQPGTIAQLEKLPRLATGKPDRRRLPEVERGKRREGSICSAAAADAQQLVQIWEELLEPRPIGIRDNFFHLGGHSLLAAQLVDRIEQAYGKRLALSTLFAKPTVEQLAEALRKWGRAGKKARVLPVQAEGSRRPFFFMHGDWTGGAFYCFALARACGAEQPFYVLEPYTFSGQEEPPTLEAIARAHIEAMREMQAQGPYRLGGFCNGGLLAYEMARQLEREGEQIEFLGLINPSEPIQFSPLRAVCEGLRRVRRLGSRRQADLFLRARHAERHIYRRLRPGGSRVQDFGKLLEIEPRLEAMFPPGMRCTRIMWGYSPGRRRAIRREPIAARSPSTGRGKSRRSPRPGIRLPGARTRQTLMSILCPGTHMSSVTDHVQDVAEILSECLSRVEHEARRPEQVAGSPPPRAV